MTVDYTQPPQQPAVPQRGWWSRNWKWVVPVGCLSVIVIAVAFVGIILAAVFGAIRSTDAYKEAFRIASTDPRVVAALGTPIESGWLVGGNVHVDNDRGDAAIDFPISGPKGKAKVHAEATKENGKWTYSVLTAHIEGDGTIDLLNR